MCVLAGDPEFRHPFEGDGDRVRLGLGPGGLLAERVPVPGEDDTAPAPVPHSVHVPGVKRG
ncbi:hypothetical protein GCM10011578_059090 [Streptomyces fuscichromogenes]|uniref:Uncharacterized protein n=1 Tax=Streptomyces fuscichromogenes TaxID=1324013 RepID=A0A918CU18_9ACTN|nr:hypothetical protein GCM10011578_059090 [Streptomyces fuscichromogenes]